MILSCNKYLPVFLKKTILAFVVLMVFNTNTTAQNYFNALFIQRRYLKGKLFNAF